MHDISPTTLAAVKDGILTDEQLTEALKHYRYLVHLLRQHGELYHLVWSHAFRTLETLEGFLRARQRDGRCADILIK